MVRMDIFFNLRQKIQNFGHFFSIFAKKFKIFQDFDFFSITTLISVKNWIETLIFINIGNFSIFDDFSPKSKIWDFGKFLSQSFKILRDDNLNGQQYRILPWWRKISISAKPLHFYFFTPRAESSEDFHIKLWHRVANFMGNMCRKNYEVWSRNKKVMQF